VARAVEQDSQTRAEQKRFNNFQGRFSQLSSEEFVVFGLVAAGKLNKQIESMLGVKRRTVEDRWARVMRKLNEKTISELVEFAVQLGL
jgi:FixJ family two-component response regulator